MAKCLHSEDILSQAKCSLLTGLLTGAGIGVIIAAIYIVWQRQRPQPKPSSTTKGDASAGSSIATPRKVLRPPRRLLEQQGSNSTCGSTDDQSVRHIHHPNGPPGFINQGAPQRRGGNLPISSVPENDDSFVAMPYNYHETDTSEYVTMESAYPQSKKEHNSYVNLKKMECSETAYANANVTNANDYDYDYVTPQSVHSLISGQPETQRGYLVMGNNPQHAHYRKPPR